MPYLTRMAVILCTTFLLGTFQQPLPELDSVIQRAVNYLQEEYTQSDPQVGLIREAPEAAPDTYWVINDNWLAARALDAAARTNWPTSFIPPSRTMKRNMKMIWPAA